MEKGNLGIRLGFYGVAAFVLAYLGYSTGLFLLAGVVLVAEKNEWATRQVIQAFCLYIASGIVSSVVYLFDFIGYIPYLGSVWNVLTQIISTALDVAVLVFAIIGVLKNMKGEDANIPLASNLADWAYGIVRPKAPKQTQTFCTGCGAPMANGAQFCNNCGKPVGQPAAPASAAAPAPTATPEQPQQ